ncbi:hypothetical protein KI688_003535 [Linnemannia hyalina]|uniref:Uncharacterized protein n=1 Tax=Linnemannia hyalina TaxID=64524 RepID=A0A9P8BSW3_9FUNG|nr:hypothetical protein KI688_003535 [Linnemannia hyalina]
MLAPLDPPASGSTTPGCSREALTSSGAAQGPITAASPQYIDGTIVTPHIGAESPYWTPTTPSRSPHVQSSGYSPSVSNLQAYSPTPASSYVPPPSPTPSQRGAYPVPEGHYYNNSAAIYPSSTDGISRQYIYQQDPYQQSYLHHQQVYPEPVVRAYPNPALVDNPITPTTAMKPTKPALVSTKKPKSTGRRKKIIWAMAIITIVLLAVVIYLVVSMKKNKDSSSSSSGGSSTSGGRVQAPPIPPYPSEKGHCPTFFCHNYFFNTCEGECKKDSVYQTCKDGCKGEFFCINDCEKGETCFDDCTTNLGRCNSYCFR